MKGQMTITNNDIDKWRHKCIAEINNYADQQIQILKDDYDQQRSVFDESRGANLDAAAAYVSHVPKQLDLFNQLHDECCKLEFQVAKLETIWVNIDRIKVITVENQMKRMQEGSTMKQSMKPDDSINMNVSLSLDPASTSPDRIK
jgi:hypothetical protein